MYLFVTQIKIKRRQEKFGDQNAKVCLVRFITAVGSVDFLVGIVVLTVVCMLVIKGCWLLPLTNLKAFPFSPTLGSRVKFI